LLGRLALYPSNHWAVRGPERNRRAIDADQIVRVKILETDASWADWTSAHPLHFGADAWDDFLKESDPRDAARSRSSTTAAAIRTPSRRSG
jgi:hypothetical protein